MSKFNITCETETNKPAKKRSRSTKKSLAAENDQHQQFLQVLLKYESSLPLNVKEAISQERVMKGSILQLDTTEIKDFWQGLEGFVSTLVCELALEKDVQDVLGAAVSLLRYSALLHTTSVAESEHFTHMAITLNSLLVQPSLKCSPELLKKICELCEYCCLKPLVVPGEFYLNTLMFLMDMTLVDNRQDNGVNAKREIVRMWEMHVPLARVNLQTGKCEELVAKLTRIVVCPTYLNWKEGRNFIAFTFSLDTKLMKVFHQTVKDFLPKCKHSQAAHYGEVYFSVWANGSTEVRQMLETHCIQNLMTHMFTFRRKKQELCHLGQNVFTILSYLHNNRKVSQFSRRLTDLYMPLLWRHLRSGNNIERCNAALVFLDVYPLEKPGAGKAEESDLLNKQHSEMVDLLTDNCHVVRIIAIKGICNKLYSAWSTFSPETVQVLMRHLLALANDGSDPNVRRTLYDSLSMLLHNAHSASYLTRVLPSLQDYIHDENEKVRRAFVKLLCCVKQIETLPVKYWKIVPLNHLTARLKLEGPEVGATLAELLMSNIYTPDLAIEKFLYRLTKLIDTCPVAARKLFQYSKKVLPYKDALKVMLVILMNLRVYVRKKVESANQGCEAKKPETSPVKKRKRRSRDALQTLNENGQNISASSETNVKEEDDSDFAKPGVVHAMVDIVSLLWVMHSQELMELRNAEDHENLLQLTCLGIPLFLMYYRGEPTYFAVVHLASLVPPSKLNPVSTVCSACMSHLRLITEDTPQAEIEGLVYALCSWNRFADIQDLVVDWLDQAFRCEGFNQSRTANEELKRRKVRFLTRGGKPLLALKLLDAIFRHPISSMKVIEKSYNLIHELFVYMERIKYVIERRLESGLPLDSPMLSDEFLLKCLYRYSKLILLLHQPEPQGLDSSSHTVIEPFNASDVFLQFIEWCQRVVRPTIPGTLVDCADFSVDVINASLRTAANLVDLNLPYRSLVTRLAELVKSLLTAECSLWFIESSLQIIKHLRDFSEANYGAEDDLSLIKTILPSLLSYVLNALTKERYTKKQVADCIQSVPEMRIAMFEVVHCLLRMYGPHSQLLHTVLKLFTDAMVAVLVHGVRQLQLLDPVDKVLELPWICHLLIPVVSKAAIASLWLATIPSSFKQIYCLDGNQLGAAVCLVHTLVKSGVNLPRPELCQVVQTAHTAVTEYTGESTECDITASSTFTADTLDIKKAALPVLTELAAFLMCPLS